jgi:hypothetical protein
MLKHVRGIFDQISESFKKFLSGPVFPQDEDKTRQAQYSGCIFLGSYLQKTDPAVYGH